LWNYLANLEHYSKNIGCHCDAEASRRVGEGLVERIAALGGK
jgi:hypothetical protein